MIVNKDSNSDNKQYLLKTVKIMTVLKSNAIKTYVYLHVHQENTQRYALRGICYQILVWLSVTIILLRKHVQNLVLRMMKMLVSKNAPKRLVNRLNRMKHRFALMTVMYMRIDVLLYKSKKSQLQEIALKTAKEISDSITVNSNVNSISVFKFNYFLHTN